jgi:hypothetical protein
MSFFVNPAGLTSFQQFTERAGEDADASRAHVDRYAEIRWHGEGIINLCRDADDEIERSVRDFLSRLATRALPGTAAAVHSAHDHYVHTDQASAARVDATLPAHDVAAADPSSYPIIFTDRPRPAPFADTYEPTDVLTAPPDFNVEMPYQPHWSDLAGPASLVRDAFWCTTSGASKLGLCDRAYDLYEIALKPCVGDWAGMATVGHVIDQVAESLVHLSANLAWAAQNLDSVWRGNAADAAAVHLHQMRRTLVEANTTMTAMASEYRTAAEGAHEFSGTIGTLISDAADAAVLAAASAAISGGLAATGAGVPLAILGAAFTLTEVYKVIKAVLTILDLVAAFRALALGFSAAGKDFGAVSGSFPLPALPAVPALPQ